MQLIINYGIVDLTPEVIQEYIKDNKFVKLVEFDQANDLVVTNQLSHNLYITPDDILCDHSGLADLNKPQKAAVYYTNNKKPKILPSKPEFLTINFNLENIKEFEHSAFDTYYCRKLFKKEDLASIYKLMEFVLPNFENLSEIYLNRTKIEKKNHVNIPICHWTKNGIICDSSLPFLFIHSDLIEEIPIVFIVDKDYKELDLDFLPKPFFLSSNMDEGNPPKIEELGLSINGKIRYFLNLDKESMQQLYPDNGLFHLPDQLKEKVLRLGIQNVFHIFPSEDFENGLSYSRFSSNGLAYKVFMETDKNEYPIILSEVYGESHNDKIDKNILNKVESLPVKEYKINSIEGNIKYSDLFEILEPVLLDQSALSSVLFDRRLEKEYLPVKLDIADKRFHLFLLGSVQPVNLNILKSYSQDDLIPIVLYYFDELFYTKKIKKQIIDKIVK